MLNQLFRRHELNALRFERRPIAHVQETSRSGILALVYLAEHIIAVAIPCTLLAERVEMITYVAVES